MSSQSQTTETEPHRSKLVRFIVRSFNFSRGKDRLFIILRSVLRIPRNVTIEFIPGTVINLDLNDYLQRWIYCHHLTDDFDYFMLGKVLQKGEHFVDIGANIGITSLIASRAVGEAGMVYSVEALPGTRRELNRNVAANGLGNVKVIPCAILDEDKDVEFFASTDGNIGGSSISNAGEKAPPIVVEGHKFDSLIENKTIEKCDVLKMDIEGAEVLALKGMKELFLNNKPRAVMIEVSHKLLGQFGAKPSEIIEFFLKHHYLWYTATANGFKPSGQLEIGDFANLWAIIPNSADDLIIQE